MARYFTALYAHLSKIDVKLGQKLKYGDKLGNQGNTGLSFGEHTHGTVVKGWITRSFSLDEAVPGGTFEPIKSEAELIFGYGDLYDPKAGLNSKNGTNFYNWDDPEYKRKYGSVHYAFDVTSKVGGYQKALYWNRTLTGEVVGVFNHPQGKGLHILIAYDADETKGNTQRPKGTVNLDGVYIRTFPKNQGGTVVDIFNSGAQVTIYDTIRDADGVRWYKIGDNRYIHRDFVDLI